MLTRRIETPDALVVVLAHHELTAADIASLLSGRRHARTVIDLRGSVIADRCGLTRLLTGNPQDSSNLQTHSPRTAVLADADAWDIAHMLAARLPDGQVFRDMGAATQWLGAADPRDDFARLQSCFEAVAAER